MGAFKVPSSLLCSVYGADLEDWLKKSKAFNFADDTSTSCKGKTTEMVITEMQRQFLVKKRLIKKLQNIANLVSKIFMLPVSLVLRTT